MSLKVSYHGRRRKSIARLEEEEIKELDRLERLREEVAVTGGRLLCWLRE